MALRKLNERLDGAAESIAQLERQVRSGQGELADLEARARALHRDLQVGAALVFPLPCRATYLLFVLQLSEAQSSVPHQDRKAYCLASAPNNMHAILSKLGET